MRHWFTALGTCISGSSAWDKNLSKTVGRGKKRDILFIHYIRQSHASQMWITGTPGLLHQEGRTAVAQGGVGDLHHSAALLTQSPRCTTEQCRHRRSWRTKQCSSLQDSAFTAVHGHAEVLLGASVHWLFHILKLLFSVDTENVYTKQIIPCISRFLYLCQAWKKILSVQIVIHKQQNTLCSSQSLFSFRCPRFHTWDQKWEEMFPPIAILQGTRLLQQGLVLISAPNGLSVGWDCTADPRRDRAFTS